MSICNSFVFCSILSLALLPVTNSQGISLQAILDSLKKQNRAPAINNAPAAPVFQSHKMSFVIEDTGIPTKRLGSLIVADPNALKKGPTGSGLPGIHGGNHHGKPYPNPGHSGNVDSHNGGKIDSTNNGGGGSNNLYPKRGDIGIVTKPYPIVPVKPLPIQPILPQIRPPANRFTQNPFMSFIDGLARWRALRSLRCRTVTQMYRLNLPVYAALQCTNICPRSFRCVSSSTTSSGGVGFCCPFFVSDYAIQLKTMLARYGVIEEQFF